MNQHVALDEKLAALQENDTHRRWRSLDDQRLCVVCGKRIIGRMIDIWLDGRGIYRMHCPTAGCPSTPRDWFYHGAARAQRSKLLKLEMPAIDLSLAKASVR